MSGSDDENLRLWDTVKFSPIGRPLVGHSRYSASAFPSALMDVELSLEDATALFDCGVSELGSK